MYLLPATIIQTPLQPPVRVQGSPASRCVYVDVDGYLVSIPLALADQVAITIRQHARRVMEAAGVST
jgi:hypothetical protein